ncbi:MAG: hypothetical protein LC792_03735 [Actinobacteria bacterium]|nr:hypothetical protein [Actinomycetota bacterium]
MRAAATTGEAGGYGTDLHAVYPAALDRGRLVVSPDGHTVAVTQRAPQSTSSTSAFLADLDADGANRRPACRDKALPAFSVPRCSPTGDRLLCLPHHRNGTTATVVTIPDSGSGTVIDASLSDPDWSPDGRRVVGTGNPSGPYRDLAVLAVDGSGRQTVLTAGANTTTAPRWSPDGRTIAFTLR